MDLDDLELDLSADWDHTKRQGKSPKSLAYMRTHRGVARAKGQVRGSAAVSDRSRKAPINLPAVSIQRDKP